MKNKIRHPEKINKPIKIAWDTGNGAMGLVVKKITSQLENTENTN